MAQPSSNYVLNFFLGIVVAVLGLIYILFQPDVPVTTPINSSGASIPLGTQSLQSPGDIQGNPQSYSPQQAATPKPGQLDQLSF